ncbi:nitroreductase/quinone reductase family protein [Terrabacter sp. LjRoot27]|uniref:nitroreductase/quinone reductase family protein n=1 Tax=Terrabacter sp. LjRoot27 TaxID=3342306 RepID=UPI003ECCD907
MRRALFVRVNRVMNVVVRRFGLRRFRGGDLLMLTTTGRRSGQHRTTPLLHLARDGDWLVVASNGGADWEPGWWLNLRAGGPGTVEVDGRVVPVRGEEVTGPEREQLWVELNDRVFDFDAYQAKVSRRIAVVRLTPSAV